MIVFFAICYAYPKLLFETYDVSGRFHERGLGEEFIKKGTKVLSHPVVNVTTLREIHTGAIRCKVVLGPMDTVSRPNNAQRVVSVRQPLNTRSVVQEAPYSLPRQQRTSIPPRVQPGQPMQQQGACNPSTFGNDKGGNKHG